ncbi:MAG: aldehyde dehydrogenase PuuC [Oleibacter sp.]|nr:aldehyde dehydrogenase PuuC [Thalassolituus sp.]
MSELTKSWWEDLASKTTLQDKAYIDGEYVSATNNATYQVINPANGKLLADMAACQAEDVNTAVAAARRTFDSGVWRSQAPAQRKAVMKKLADLIRNEMHELALLETLNMGKPVLTSLNLDIPGSAACFEWYAEAIDKLYGEVAPTDGNNFATITREPIGVVGAVVPWNFPLDIAAWKLAPALIAGNSVVLKPAEQSPHTILRVAELAVEAGLPAGVLNIIPGRGEEAGKALGLHMDVDCLAFTGSTAVGKYFMRYSADSNMKPVWPETGGKSPNLIFADCDFNAAVAGAVAGIFSNQGEICSANSRILVENSIKDKFTEAFVAAAKNMVVGDPLEADTEVGAIVDQTQVQRIMGFVERAGKDGAKLLCGGNTLLNGACVEPTVFTDVDPAMELATEEVFGPVAAVIGFDSEEEAIRIANDSVYGLAASVWSQNLSRVHRVSAALRAGTVSVNTVDAIDFSTPFGGYKQSGFGRDLSLHALDKFTQLKTTWIKLA